MCRQTNISKTFGQFRPQQCRSFTTREKGIKNENPPSGRSTSRGSPTRAEEDIISSINVLTCEHKFLETAVKEFMNVRIPKL